MKRKIALLLFVIIIIPAFVFSQQSDSIKTVPKLYPLWTFYVPGATHFYDGRIGTGIALTAFEVGFTTLGIVYDKDLSKNSNSPYYNYPLFIGLNALSVDKCDFLRRQLEYVKFQRPDFKYDEMKFTELLKQPFKPKNIFTPITIGFILLAGAELWLDSRYSEVPFHRVDKMSFLNRYIDKNTGLAVYGTASLAMSMEAGIGEEYIFRNYLMPVLDYRLGQRKGLIISSAVFGGMHAFNYFFVSDPNPWDIISQVSFTAVMGYILGRNVQLNEYKIGKAVAAHTWYDFTLMLGSFLTNPKENIFGVNVTLKL
jgi:membrane protease YdiL (CAAX protease family)